MSNKDEHSPNFWQVLVSVLGAIFGVQSRKVYERDALHGRSWWIYGLVGIFVVSLLIICLVLLAKFLVRQAGIPL